jgi:hypothetical protein
MSVVAGCSLFNGVLLTADCRITYRWPNGHRQHADIAQKLFFLAPGHAVGFVSDDVRLASLMIRVLLEQVTRRPRLDHFSLMQWMPRLFRRACEVWRRDHRDAPYTAFLGASVLPWAPNVVRRADVAAIMNHIAFGQPAIQRNWIPPILVRILETPAHIEVVALGGTARGLLYTMEPPDYEPRYHETLHFTAIGTGRGVVGDIARVHDWIVAGDVGNRFVEAQAFVDSVERFARENAIDDVGGLYPLLRVDAGVGGDMVQAWGYGREIPAGGDRIELTYDQSGWVQRNSATGREMRLVPPWRVDVFRNAGVFDDLDEAIRRFNGL